MEQSDEDLARLLQEQEYQSAAAGGSAHHSNAGTSSPFIFPEDDDTDVSKNDAPQLDLDTEAPFKDLHGLFLAFNDQYFESRLSACEVRWSPRMTSCAGLCYYQSKAQYCSIRLSEPLLKFRPESDYIETLLHEMIHAYLFVTQAIQDHDGHGADFQYHMKRINDAAGTSITIYHTFHDEVRHYQTHVWKCNGPCQQRPPYFGIVKRAMNRPPQPADRWYAEHQETCGGTYTKISEPEPSKKKISSKSRKSIKPDPEPKGRTLMDEYFSVSKTLNTGSSASPLPPSSPRHSSETKELVKLKKNGEMSQGSAGTVIAGSSRTLGNTDSEKVAEANRPSPKEAAAAAALARFEHQRNLNDLNAATAPVASSMPSKRKDRESTPYLQLNSETLKKIKTEETLTIRRNDLEAKINEEARIKIEEQDHGATPLIKQEDQSQASTRKHHLESAKPSIKSEIETATLVPCPVCSKKVEESTINDHVDLCIWRASGEAE